MLPLEARGDGCSLGTAFSKQARTAESASNAELWLAYCNLADPLLFGEIGIAAIGNGAPRG